MSRKPLRVLATLLVLLLVGVSSAVAQVTQALQYQGRLTDAGGNPLTAASASLQFDIYDAASAGNLVFTQAFANQPLSSGQFTVALTNVDYRLTNALKSGAALWVQTTVNGAVLSPRQPITSVLTAFKAQRADTAAVALSAAAITTIDGSQITGTGSINPSLLGAGIDGSKLAGAGSINPSLLGSGIGGSKLSGAGSISGTLLAAGSVDSTRLAAGSLGNSVLKPGLNGTLLLDASVDGSKLAGTGSIGGALLTPGTVGPNQLTPGAVDSVRTGAGALTGANLRVASVGRDRLADPPVWAFNFRQSQFNVGPLNTLLSAISVQITTPPGPDSVFVEVDFSAAASQLGLNSNVMSFGIFDVDNTHSNANPSNGKGYDVAVLAGNVAMPLSGRRVFKIARGPHTFYLNCIATNGNGDVGLNNMSMVARYIPTVSGSAAYPLQYP